MATEPQWVDEGMEEQGMEGTVIEVGYGATMASDCKRRKVIIIL